MKNIKFNNRFGTMLAIFFLLILFIMAISSQNQSNAKEPSSDIEALAKMLWGEARGIKSDTEKAACCWVVLNRVDDKRWPNSVEKVLSQKYQFGGYDSENPVDEELYSLAEDVYYRWLAEKEGEEDVGRVIPNDYYFWCGDRKCQHNWFWQIFDVRDYYTWWMESPYEN